MPAKISKITKAEPPPGRTQKYDWDKIAVKLEASPGEWFKVFEKDSANYATAIRNNDIKALRSGRGFVMRTSNNTRGSNRTCSLFLMFDPTKRTEG